MAETLRQQIARWLALDEYDFHQLREMLGVSVRDLERALRHVERSARGRGQRLHIAPPSCADCGFGFPGRAARHLHPPGRCPRCRGERIEPPRFRIEG